MKFLVWVLFIGQIFGASGSHDIPDFKDSVIGHKLAIQWWDEHCHENYNVQENVQEVRERWSRYWFDVSDLCNGKGRIHDDGFNPFANGSYRKLARVFSCLVIKLPPLREWFLDHIETALTKEEYSWIKGLKIINNTGANHHYWARFSDAIKGNSTLKIMDVSNNRRSLNESLSVYLIKGLQTSSITNFSFAGNEISPAVADAFVTLFEAGKKFESLNLMGCKWTGWPLQRYESVQKIGKAAQGKIGELRIDQYKFSCGFVNWERYDPKFALVSDGAFVSLMTSVFLMILFFGFSG
jgi:hypothetical protein